MPSSRRSLLSIWPFALALLAVLAVALAAPPAGAQDAEAPLQTSTPTAPVSTKWGRTLSAAEAYVAAGAADGAETALYTELLDDVISEAKAEKTKAETDIGTQQPLLDALGPAPDVEKQQTEAEDIALLREEYRRLLDDARSRIAAADIVIVRAEQLRAGVARLARQELATQLNQRAPDPWAASSLAQGVKEIAAAWLQVVDAPSAWRASLSEEEWATFNRQRLPWLAAVTFAAIVLGFIIRRILRTRFGYGATAGHITQARRLGGAVSRMAADGLTPSAVILVIYLWTERELAGMGAPLLIDAVAGAAIGLSVTLLAYAGLSAALTPGDPPWRLLPVRDAAAHTIRARALVFAIVSAIDVFLWTALASVVKSPEFMTVYAMAACGARALTLLPLLQGRLWRLKPETAPTPAATDEPLPRRRRSPVWALIRLAAGAAALGAVVAAATGYADLALFVGRALSGTMVTVGAVFLLRGAAREGLQAAMNARPVRRWLGIGPEGADALTFWGHVLLEPVFFFFAAIFTAPLWGFTQREMLSWAGGVMSGFRIGEATISPAAIGVAILAFVVVLVLSRAAQHALLHRLLPRTRMDPGAQNSLATAFGYFGVSMAAVIGVSALGFDLSNLAIVAGALSVGIGFGLQSIVNNFVSGLILLAERPVKVGDWVIVGDQQGIVKRISIRATEFETFDRSSVIIPNSELIANSVTNRTHKDRYGRIEIPVGVAYGSDTRKVEELLLDIGRKNAEVLRLPEPLVVFTNFGASSLDFELRVYTSNNLRSLAIATDIRHEIAARFEAEGVEIPFPQRVVHMAAAPATGEEDS